MLKDPYKDEYLLWTMLEWFSPLAWWRMKLKQILDIERQRGISEDHIENLVSIVIIHRPYFMEQGKLWSRNEAQVWGTFEVYPLEESYRHQLARHLCEINNYSYKNVDPNLPSSSQRPKESYPTDRIIPQNTDDGQIRTEFYVPEPVFQKAEDLADDYSSLNRDWEDYNAQLMEDLLHKKRYRYHHPMYRSLTRSEVQNYNLSLSTRSDHRSD